MSAHSIYDNETVGSLIRYSDGTLKPPVRFSRKLAARENRNSAGAPCQEEPARDRPNLTSPAELLHLAESHEAAERWLTQHRYSNVLLNEVTEDEVGADVVEGRAA